MMLSKYFTKAEMIRSAKAKKLGIDNTPPQAIIDNLMLFCRCCADRVRELFGVPISPSSGYRCPKLNVAVGGSATSDHPQGFAMDFNVPGHTVRQAIGKIVRSGIVFDQLIDEYGTWIHVGYRPLGRNRNQILIIRKGSRKIVSKDEAAKW